MRAFSIRRVFRNSKNFTSGNPLLLDDIQEKLVVNIGTNRKKISPYNEGSSWKLGYGTKDTVELLKFMYYYH